MLIGDPTRDAELLPTKSGKSVSNIRLATNCLMGGDERSQFHTATC
jgi:hypothetical protein